MNRMKLTAKTKKLLFHLAIFLSPFLALTFFTVLFGYAPLGSTPANLSGDAQYLSYLSSLHSMIRGDGFFSFAELATDASHLYARYAGSPFTWLNALFPVGLHAAVAFLLLAIKSGLCALTFSFYLKHRRPTLSAPFLFILSFSFSLPAWIGLTDGLFLVPEQLILLPLLLLALEKFIENGKSGLLLFALSFVLLTGYAVAYATLFFALLAVLLAFIEGRISGAQIKKACAHLLLPLLLSLLFALPILIFALMNLSAIGAVNTYSGSLLYRLPMLLLGFLPGVTNPEFPVFYIGLLPLLLFPLFFASRAFSVRYRASFGAILLIFCAYFFFFNPFSGALGFGLSFLVLLLTSDLLSSDSPYQKLPFTIMAAILLLVPMLLQKLSYRIPSDGGDLELLAPIFGVYIPLALIFLAALTLPAFLTGKKVSRALTALLVVILLADGCAATFWRTSGKTFLETEKVVEADTLKEADLLLSEANVIRSPITRTRLLISGNTKISARHTYLLGAQNGRALSPELAKLLCAFGTDMHAEIADIPVPFADALIGASYVISDTSLRSPHYKSIHEKDTLTLYSASALPTVFAASSDALAFEAHKEQPFLSTNEFLSALLGEATTVYHPLSAMTVTQSDGKVTYSGTATVSGTLCYYTAKSGSHNLNVTVSGTSVRPYEDGFKHGILSLGTVNQNADVTALQNKQAPITDNAFYIADQTAFDQALSALNERRLETPVLQGNTLTGSITLDSTSSLLMTTLPYDADYLVRIDGKTAESVSVEGLLAVKATLGTHTVSIERPASAGIDLLPTLIGLGGALLALILLLAQKMTKKQGKAK